MAQEQRSSWNYRLVNMVRPDGRNVAVRDDAIEDLRKVGYRMPWESEADAKAMAFLGSTKTDDPRFK